MRWFANLKTAYKLGVGFGLGIVITLIIGVVCLSRMGNIAEILSTTYKVEEVNASASELSNMAARLQGLVGQFRLEEQPARSAERLSLPVLNRRKAA